ncbi:F-box/kelch-repeat protein At2g44130-like [Brassica napus]|uniref:F-box domain-containing protein n=1 Tax=Brassica oleracea var. oleracea TaxID=109376 RepID=A0A0D3B6N8_BRAOL|nr:PREDICTED: F-box/kelch-repeat protein At2g44130-like [Brassica oleracea var. oleracea]XP_013683862.1 F-box/kelch-repeat protein At2g44130-like [Brassica napus]
MIMDKSSNRAEEVSKDLIPGLPSELAMECLVRVPYQFQSAMRSVCRSWRSLLSDSSFIKERRRCGKAELLLCLVQPLSPPTLPVVEEEKSEKRVSGTPRFGLSVYNATMATWNRVALPQQQIPLFCECVAVQDAGKILLIGGWDPETLQPVKDVYVLEGSGRRWRRGAPMKESRSFFACASVGSTKVYVAGGHDEQKNALRSAEVYDVEKDQWSTIAWMAEGRDECQGLAMGTGVGFCVLSGYATESQGRFRQDGEVYDPMTKSWSRIENAWPFPDTSPRGRTVVDTRGSSRLCRFSTDRELQSQRQWESRDGSRKWNLDVEVTQLPTSGSSVYVGSSGGESVVMIGGRRETKGLLMKTTTEKNAGKWSHVNDIPFGFSTLPFSHASIYV